MNRLVVEAVEIDGVGTINGDFTAIDEGSDGIDDMEIFVLRKAAERSREQNERQSTPVAEDEHFELAAERRSPPFYVVFVHVVFVISSEAVGGVEKSLIPSFMTVEMTVGDVATSLDLTNGMLRDVALDKSANFSESV